MSHAGEHDHGQPTGVDVQAEVTGGLRGLGAALLVVGALCLSGGLWMLLRPTPASLADQAALELGQGHLERAFELAARSIEEDPRSAGAWLAHGRCLRALERPGEARASLERACALEPGDWAAQLELASACRELGDAPAARAALERARILAPDEPGVQALADALGG